MGSANTFILLTSSWLVAEQVKQNREESAPGTKRLWLVFLLGLAFLILKFVEYGQHIEHGLFPGPLWHPDFRLNNHAPLFFFLYFFTTGLHALHLLIGLVLLAILQLRPLPNERKKTYLEIFALYWHFVDIIWVFLFPLFYLGGRP